MFSGASTKLKQNETISSDSYRIDCLPAYAASQKYNVEVLLRSKDQFWGH